MHDFQELVAKVSDIEFDVELALEQQLGGRPLIFKGMDKTSAPVCRFFLKKQCARGTMCPYRHARTNSNVVCKHWLRGLCKKSDDCQYLHEYNMEKMAECTFYAQGSCTAGSSCKFLHIDPESKRRDCPYYDHGFCKFGPLCRHRHVKRVPCQNYLFGFCPEGPKCKYFHPKWDVEGEEILARNVVCHYCSQYGHRAAQCPMNPDCPPRPRAGTRPAPQVGQYRLLQLPREGPHCQQVSTAGAGDAEAVKALTLCSQTCPSCLLCLHV
eukprot:Colp12_sorted_trinity150504_noHs@25260